MIKLAIFDMDGTVFESRLDWLKIRNELNISPGQNILKDIHKDGTIDESRLELLEKHEWENTQIAKPINGVIDFIDFLKTLEINTALVTNNNKQNTDYLLKKFDVKFDCVVTREMNYWKPEPDAFFYVMKQFNREPSETVSFGDTHYDIEASKAAGLASIYILPNPKLMPKPSEDIIFFEDYSQLKELFLNKFN
jgi:HAD superfamily hydrolase (TIGR01509 family)